MPGFLKSGLIIISRLFLRCAVQSVSSAGKVIGFTEFFLFHLASICSSRKGMVIGALSPPNLRIPKKYFRVKTVGFTVDYICAVPYRWS